MSKMSGIVKFFRRNAAAYMFLTPWLLGFLVLTLYPMVYSLWLGFTNYDFTTARCDAMDRAWQLSENVRAGVRAVRVHRVHGRGDARGPVLPEVAVRDVYLCVRVRAAEADLRARLWRC